MTVVNPTHEPIPHPPQGFKSFNAFYPFYLGEHSLPTTRRLHLVGTSIALLSSARAALSLVPRLLAFAYRSLNPMAGVPSLQRFIGQLLRIAQPLRLDGSARMMISGIVSAYTFAWVGHFFVEKNRPATFKYPIWSLRGDIRLWWEVVTLRRAF